MPRKDEDRTGKPHSPHPKPARVVSIAEQKRQSGSDGRRSDPQDAVRGDKDKGHFVPEPGLDKVVVPRESMGGFN